MSHEDRTIHDRIARLRRRLAQAKTEQQYRDVLNAILDLLADTL